MKKLLLILGISALGTAYAQMPPPTYGGGYDAPAPHIKPTPRRHHHRPEFRCPKGTELKYTRHGKPYCKDKPMPRCGRGTQLAYDRFGNPYCRAIRPHHPRPHHYR